ncbi:Na+/H+ antiporter NhaC [Bacillus tianshenii]|nr:Na+/H+ antiporter NhaC [Bacillus tianshenii]
MQQKDKNITFGLALIPMLVMVVAMGVTIVKFEGSPHIPLILGAIVSAFIAWRKGFSWRDIEQSAYKGIRLALPAILIIITVGITIGAWIGGGIVATMVYYGLKLISPSLFLVSISIICAIVTLAIGSSWSTMGTIGVAGMGIGASMGIPLPMVAGAIISGSYFGDKMSPLSDTTNLASGVVGADLFDHIRHMLYTTIPGFVISIIIYWFMGRKFTASSLNNENIANVMDTLQANFVISPLLLLVPAIVIVLVARRVPALPALFIGVILGWASHILVQGGAIGTAVNTLQGGYSITSGNEMVDTLFNRGGIDDMMYTVSLTIVAMTFGGIMEHTGMLKALVDQILKLARSARSLVVTTIVSAFFTNVAAAEQYISVVLPGRMYAQAYHDKNLHPKNLSRAVEDGGTLTSPFVPWNTCGVYIYSTLGVSAFQYAPYALVNFIVPILAIIFATVGFKLAYMTDTEAAEWDKLLKEKENQAG